jgi:glutathione synthase/RimK-type ligase-like ATP-grasp enzyme
MLLILTNTGDATASFLISALKEQGLPFIRLDTDQLISRIAIAYRSGVPAIKIDNVWREATEFEHLWYRRPEPLKDNRFENSSEGKYVLAEWTEFVECFLAHVQKPKWMNHPSCNAAASHKLEQLTIASTFGFEIPDTLVTQEDGALRGFFQKHHGQVIVKPIASGYVERAGEQIDSLIYTNRVRKCDLENLDDLQTCPALFQQFIQKHYDVRITVVDADIHAVAIFGIEDDGKQRCDIRRNNMSDVRYEIIGLPTTIKTSVIKLMNHYGLRFAAIDMAVTMTGQWFYFEVNANGQWAWLDMCAGSNIASSFIKSFQKHKLE